MPGARGPENKTESQLIAIQLHLCEAYATKSSRVVPYELRKAFRWSFGEARSEAHLVWLGDYLACQRDVL